MNNTVKPRIADVLIVPGQPHILLAADKSPSWAKLKDAFERARKEIVEKSGADLILYFSTQWLSVIGHLFQTDPTPEWTHVDPNWHEFGSMPYKFRVDADFGKAYAETTRAAGYHAAEVNYRGFPIDTGTIVAQKFLNPDNKTPAAMVSCNIYAEKVEMMRLGQAAAEALVKQSKKVLVVLVTGLSSRYEVTEVEPKHDKVSSAKDHEWNLKICELLGEGRLEDVAQCAREFGRQANADMGFKGIWWLNALCGQTNNFKGKVYDYQPVWGTGAAIVHLKPTSEVVVTIDDSGPEIDEVAQAAQKFDDVEKSKVVTSMRAPEPVGPYPHARRQGDLLFLSGIGPRQRGSKEIPGVSPLDIEKQTAAVIENIRTILNESGASLDKIVDVQVFLVDIDKNFKKFNEVYARYFTSHQPTRTTVGVTALPTPIAVEMKVVASLA